MSGPLRGLNDGLCSGGGGGCGFSGDGGGGRGDGGEEGGVATDNGSVVDDVVGGVGQHLLRDGNLQSKII